jgi:hypothetical protein
VPYVRGEDVQEGVRVTGDGAGRHDLRVLATAALISAGAVRPRQ